MQSPAIIIAAVDIADIIRLLFIFGIVGFSIISKIMNANAEAKRKAGGKPKPNPQARPGQPPMGQNRPGQARPGQARPGQAPMGQAPAQGGRPQNVDNEIEEFLRQAKARREGGGAPQRAPQPQPPPPPTPKPATPRPATLPQTDYQPGENFGRGVSAHVQEHLNTNTISQRDARLSEAVSDSDERVENRLEAVFNHDVGHLEHNDDINTQIQDGTDATFWDEKEAVDGTADLIRKTLQSPTDVRNAFIISEILKRPEV